jgi:hypothetical protein
MDLAGLEVFICWVVTVGKSREWNLGDLERLGGTGEIEQNPNFCKQKLGFLEKAVKFLTRFLNRC